VVVRGWARALELAKAALLCGALALASGPAAGQEGAAPVAPEPAPGMPSDEAAHDPAPAVAATDSAPLSDLIERAWRAPAASLEERVERTRHASLEAGVWSLDAAARALAGVGGDPVERARGAVRLAPDLPAARMGLAHALWRRGDSPLEALEQAAAALATLFRHTEATLWLAGSALAVLAAGLVLGGLACIAGAGALALPHATHDLGDGLGSRAPAFARAALVASALLVPALLGEGVLGLALGLLAMGALYGSGRDRVALATAAVAVWAGAFPVAALAGRCLEALERDRVAAAAFAAETGSATSVELQRLRAAEASDPLAARALARRARRAERLGEADARYQELLAQPGADAALANDAANVRLRLGHVQPALDLYQRSLAARNSAPVLFNLSQAHARAFEVELLTRVLERAQALDGELVAELTRVQGVEEAGAFVVDLPLPSRRLWARLARAGDGRAFAAEARAPLAPGRAGASSGVALAALLAPVAAGALLAPRLRRSRWCTRCGRRSCPRCDGAAPEAELCAGCHRLFFQPDQTQRAQRIARVAALEGRRRRLDRLAVLAGLLVPGAAGLLALRPLRALLACVLFAMAAAAVVWRHGVAPDPGVAGGAGPAALLALAALAALAYAALATASVAARRSEAP
jgi:hypothetical protein